MPSGQKGFELVITSNQRALCSAPFRIYTTGAISTIEVGQFRGTRAIPISARVQRANSQLEEGGSVSVGVSACVWEACACVSCDWCKATRDVFRRVPQSGWCKLGGAFPAHSLAICKKALKTCCWWIPPSPLRCEFMGGFFITQTQIPTRAPSTPRTCGARPSRSHTAGSSA